MSTAISSVAARAFVQGKRFSKSNTNVRRNIDGSVEMRLWDNLIARHTVEDGTQVTLAGWGTATTRARLNAITDELVEVSGNTKANSFMVRTTQL